MHDYRMKLAICLGKTFVYILFYILEALNDILFLKHEFKMV